MANIGSTVCRRVTLPLNRVPLGAAHDQARAALSPALEVCVRRAPTRRGDRGDNVGAESGLVGQSVTGA